jgi:26S proteasome regulatory subunit T1
MKPEAISSFLDGAIRSRIAIRFIAEQHIAFTRALKLALDRDAKQHHVLGVVDSECSPTEMVNLCTAFVRELCIGTFGMAPEIVLEGMTDVTFTFVSFYGIDVFSTQLRADTSQST